ncbi:MAG TPA: hypothetical protein VEW95_05615 [Candidatus Limnocylindrales bacterium]|nr:hypothetical protein [Candidatus Limnocylindrales bacterium]
MSVAENSELWFDAIGGIFAGIPECKAVFAGGRSAADSEIEPIQSVQSMIDEPLLAAPAIVLGYGGGEVITNNWEGTKHTIEGAVWIDKEPVQTSFAECIAWIDRIQVAIPPRGRAFNQDERLKSVVLMTFGRITPRTWPEGSDSAYLTLPFTLEAQLRQATRHKPE